LKIKFYAHASFRLEGQDRTVVTDPYEPKVSQFDPIDEPADLVLMSSDTDRFHNDPSHVRGNPTAVNTLTVPEGGASYAGIPVRAFPCRERVQLKLLLAGFLPRKNAMYAFDLDGLRVLHTGDIGIPFRKRYLDELRGKVDVMFALSGGVHNIDPGRLMKDIREIKPRIVIPMHYYSPKGRLKILPVEDFMARFPKDRVVRAGSSELEVTRESLPALPGDTTLYVLEQSR
jgi:L-ascorbate metabolism protein UlaG (beta-lactamase superfamily)